MNFDAKSSVSSAARISRLGAALLICALAASPFAISPASAAPTGTMQDMPGLADVPHSQRAVVSKPLEAVTFKTEGDEALLDSAVLLKSYYYAYSGTPIDYSAVLTANTDNIVPPTPVEPTASDKAAIDRLASQAKAHPDILIKADDIALDAYDRKSRSFEVVNRLFIDGGRFYFDNSPFHYTYSNPAGFRSLPCRDAKTIAAIDSAVENYQHFSMDISAHVSHADSKDKSLTFELRKVTLKDARGNTLITVSAL
jgi:hypothetical protein